MLNRKYLRIQIIGKGIDMSRLIKCAHIQASNPKHDGTPSEIKRAMIEKHIPLIRRGRRKRCEHPLFTGNILWTLFLL